MNASRTDAPIFSGRPASCNTSTDVPVVGRFHVQSEQEEGGSTPTTTTTTELSTTGAPDPTVSGESADVHDTANPSVVTDTPTAAPSLTQRSNVHRSADVHIIQGDESADNDSTDEHDTYSVPKDGVICPFLTMFTDERDGVRTTVSERLSSQSHGNVGAVRMDTSAYRCRSDMLRSTGTR